MKKFAATLLAAALLLAMTSASGAAPHKRKDFALSTTNPAFPVLCRVPSGAGDDWSIMLQPTDTSPRAVTVPYYGSNWQSALRLGETRIMVVAVRTWHRDPSTGSVTVTRDVARPGPRGAKRHACGFGRMSYVTEAEVVFLDGPPTAPTLAELTQICDAAGVRVGGPDCSTRYARG